MIKNYHLREKLDNFKIMCERYMYLLSGLSRCGTESLIMSTRRRKSSSDPDVLKTVDGHESLFRQVETTACVMNSEREREKKKNNLLPKYSIQYRPYGIPSTNRSRMHSRILDGNTMSDRHLHSRFALFVRARIMHRNIRAFKA